MFLALEPAGAGQLDEEREIPVERTSSPYDVVEAFQGLAETSEHIDTDQLAESLTDARRPDPQHPRGVPGGPRRRVRAVGERRRPRRADQLAAAQPRARSRSVLDERDQDIVALMKDADVLFRALVARREAVHNLLVSTSPLSEELTAAGAAEPRRPQAGADPPRERRRGAQQERGQPRQQPAADGAVLPGLRQHPRQRSVVRHLHPEPAARPARWVADMDGIVQAARRPRVVLVACCVAAAAFSDVRRRASARPSPRTSPAPSRSTRAATCGCSASPSARSTRSTPSGTDVEVTMSYDADVQAPGRRQGRDRRAVDRGRPVRPAHAGLRPAGDVLADGAVLDHRPDRRARSSSTRSTRASTTSTSRSARPAPTSNGALSDLLDGRPPTTSAARARQFHQTIKDFGQLSATLADNKEELFGTAASSSASSRRWPTNDTTVRQFNQSLAEVSDVLAGERQELAAALENLGAGADAGVGASSRRTGRPGPQHHRPQPGLQGAGQAARGPRRDPQVAPLALNNLALTYNPQAGTLDTSANIGELVNQIENDPAALLCGIVEQAERPAPTPAT